jgi:hypothetical protein
VGGGGASRALDRGWEAAEVAVDGKSGLRRGSDEVGCSGKGKTVQMWLRECKRECTGSSRTRFKSRRRHVSESWCWRTGGGRGSSWRLRRDVEERGVGQRGVGSGGAGAGAAQGAEGSGVGAAGARHMAGEGGGGSGVEKTKRRNWR